MYRENRKEFLNVLKEIQTKLPNIEKIEPVRFELLHESNPRQLVFIEDPEKGLYHQYLKSLAGEMIKSVGTGFSKQLFVTTHSPFFVNALSPRNVWVLTKGDDGFSTIKRASEYDFVSELSDEGVPLGDMWYSNCFGQYFE